MSGVSIKENVPLAPFTTMKIGGSARYFVQVMTEHEATEVIRTARQRHWDIFILGGGSNVVVSDKGFPGLVILNRITGFESESSGDKIRVRVGSGEIWDDFVRRAVDAGWAGIENLSGVPGTVGSAPVQNIGCYGQSVQDSIVAVRTISIPDGKIRIFNRQDCGFRYRDSVFRSGEYGRYFITEVVFELSPGGNANVSAYPDIEKYFENWDRTPTLREMRQALLEIRARKGMVIMPEYESYNSVGSFFKNPVVSPGDFAEIERKVESKEGNNIGHVGKWFWEQKDGTVKVSAARLIELSGFMKGYTEGNVGISPKHSLAIINRGGATAREIATFAAKIRSAVEDRFGVKLEFEVQFVGPFEN